MELIIVALFGLVVFLYYKVNFLNKHLTVLSFSEGVMKKLLIKKEIIQSSDFETAINEVIGDMDPDLGDKVIKNAKDIGIVIPQYMDEEELKEYIVKQQINRANNKLSYTDRMILEED